MDFASVIEAIKQIQPTLTAVADTGAAITTIGGWAVSLVKAGKKADVFRISREKKKKTGKKAAKPTDIALVVDVTWSISPQVMKYLEDKKIDAEIILMVNNQKAAKDKWLKNDKPKDWEAVAHDFSMGVQKIYTDQDLANANVHIFIASPVALAFSLGAVWGTVHRATVYQWDTDERTYYPVIVISKKLLEAAGK